MTHALLTWICFVVAGFVCGAVVLSLGLQLGLYDALPPDAQLEQFKTSYMGGTMWAWLAGTVAGALAFCTGPRFYAALVSMPLTLPLAYSIVTLARFT